MTPPATCVNLRSCTSRIDRHPTGDANTNRDQTQYHYIVVRDDLPPGVAAAQIAHAAGFSAQLRWWRDGSYPILKPNAHVVVLRATQAQLCKLLDSMSHEDLVAVVEVDAPYTGQLLAVGVRPAERCLLNRDVLRTLPLYGEKEAAT